MAHRFLKDLYSNLLILSNIICTKYEIQFIAENPAQCQVSDMRENRIYCSGPLFCAEEVGGIESGELPKY